MGRVGGGGGKEREFLVSLPESILVLPIVWLLNNFFVVMNKINSLKKKKKLVLVLVVSSQTKGQLIPH